MVARLTAGAVLLTLYASVASQTIPPVPLERFPEPVETKVDRATAYCITVSSSLRVCDVDRDERGFELILLAGDQRATLAEGRSVHMQGRIAALSADLDADGTRELVVVDHVGSTNGLVMTDHRISIIENAERPNRSWVSFNVREFGEGPGTFVRRADRAGNWILSTEWERSATLDPGRGPGTYLVGRWFRYENRKLVSEPGVIVRRLLNSLSIERSGDLSNQPYSFFVDGKGRSVEEDPGLGSGQILSTLEGKLTRVTPDDTYDLVLTIGRKTYATFAQPYGENPAEHIDHIGLASQKRLLPAGIRPSALGMDVTGRRIRLIRYKDGNDGEKSVLWID